MYIHTLIKLAYVATVGEFNRLSFLHFPTFLHLFILLLELHFKTLNISKGAASVMIFM